jgi:hypothetical protein
MARIGRSYPRFETAALERGQRNAAIAYRRFFAPIAPFAEPVLDATERHKSASGLLALLTIIGFTAWLLGLWPSV